jgi:hypothetical protein
MADLGNRSSAMGPQPIAEPFVVPPAMLAAFDHIAELLAQGRRSELEALVAPKAAGELRELMDSIAPGAYQRHEIIAHAKANNHYLRQGADVRRARRALHSSASAEGEQEGRWVIWEAVNLAGGRTAWTR